MTEARREDYWENIDAEQKTIVDHIRADAPDWDVLAVDVTGREDESLFLLVIRRRVNEDKNLILSERYYRFDLDEKEGHWLSNGIERRVTGSLAAALRVLYVASTNGDVDPDDPMLMDSREDGLQYHPEELTDSLGELLEEPEPEPEPEDAPEGIGQDHPDRKGWVSCSQCGESIPEKDAVQYGEGDIGEFWVCENIAECENNE